MKSLLTLCLCSVLLSIAAHAADQNVSYPEDKPAITLTLPEDWVSETKQGRLYAHPPDDVSLFVEVKPLDATKKEGSKAIAEIKEWISQNFEDVKYDKLEEGGTNGLGLYILNAEGVGGDGKAFLNAAMVTFPDSDELFLMLAIATPDGSEKYGKTAAGIFESVRKAD